MAVISTARRSKRSNPSAEAMRLTDLSDDSLLIIFGELPVLELVRFQATCRRWQSVIALACRYRRVLIITDGSKPIAETLSRRPYDYYFNRYLLKEDGSPYEVPLTGGQYVLAVKLKSSDPRKALLLRAKVCRQLPQVLPGIRRLYISIAGWKRTFDLLGPLLQAWAKQLRRLHLVNWDPKDEWFGHGTSPGIDLMLASLSGMRALQHLHFNCRIRPSFSLANRFPFSLLNQLRSCQFQSDCFIENWPRWANDTFPLLELSTYLNEQSPLRDLAIPHGICLGALQRSPLPEILTRRLTELNIFDYIHEGLVDTFGRLCTGLSSLVHLSIKATLPPVRLVAHLSRLSTLTSLSYDYHMSGNSAPGTDAANLPLVSLSSIKTLIFTQNIRRHSDIQHNFLAALFPGLQMILLRSSSSKCLDCDHSFLMERNLPFDTRKAAQCDEHCQAYLGSFSQLAKVLTQKRTCLRQWDTSPNGISPRDIIADHRQ